MPNLFYNKIESSVIHKCNIDGKFILNAQWFKYYNSYGLCWSWNRGMVALFQRTRNKINLLSLNNLSNSQYIEFLKDFMVSQLTLKILGWVNGASISIMSASSSMVDPIEIPEGICVGMQYVYVQICIDIAPTQ